MTFHPNYGLLSHSSDALLDTCPRKYQLYKLGFGRKEDIQIFMEDETDETEAVYVPASVGRVHLDFGTLVGDATQHYLVCGDLTQTIFRMFCTWGLPLEGDDVVEKKGKGFYHGVWAIQKFVEFRKHMLGDYEVVYFQGKPATELGFSINFLDSFYDRGFLDCLLRHKVTGELAVYEGKTTGYKYLNTAMYANSGQGLSYDLIVDTISKVINAPRRETFKVLYSIYSSAAREWELMVFIKTHASRAAWIKSKLMRKNHIQQYAGEDFFPMHGQSCFSYNSPCEYFGICETSDKVLFPSGKENQPVKEDKDRYQFQFNILDIIQEQLANLTGADQEELES